LLSNPNSYYLYRYTTDTFAARGDLQMLRYARENGCPWSESLCVHAATHGRLEVLRWARENGCPWDPEDVLGAAEMHGHAEVVAWARANGGGEEDSEVEDSEEEEVAE
jgi:hypothetical protein